jgi:nucleotidyltransferase/DNA polymerase involved in DNA repair
MTEDLTEIDGVGDAIAEQLREAGFDTVADVQDATVDELADVHLIGEASAKAILNGDDEAHGGRPSMLDEYEDELLAAARKGLTYEGIARVAGVGVSTLHEWRDEHDQFSESLERARAKAERELIEDVDAEFVLERSYGYVKTERLEADIDQTTEHELGESEQELALETIRHLQERESQ